AKRPTIVPASTATRRAFRNMLFMSASPDSLSHSAAEYTRKFDFWLVPADFQLFPVLRPRPAVIVDVAWIPGCQLCGLAVGADNVTQAFDVRVSLSRMLESGRTIPLLDGVQWRNERLRIVECRIDSQSSEASIVVAPRRKHLDRLQRIA